MAKESKDNFSDNYFRTISGGVGIKPIPPYQGEIMIQECNTKRYIYRRPVFLYMEKTHKKLKKEKTCEQTLAHGDCNWCDKLGYNCPTCDPTNTGE